MNIVTLKNGTEEAEGLVAGIVKTLQTIGREMPTAFYDIVRLCRDPQYLIFGGNHGPIGMTLKDYALITVDVHGKALVHDSIRNIVLSAVTGEELEMQLGNPLKEVAAI